MDASFLIGIGVGLSVGASVGWLGGRRRRAPSQADTVLAPAPSPSPPSRAAETGALAERLEVALEATGVAAWDADVAAGTCWWSDTFAAMLGFTSVPEMPRDFWESRIHPEDRDRVLSTVGSHLRGDTEIYDYVYRLRREDGRYIWIEAKGRCLRDEHGVAVRYVGIMADITERIAIEAERIAVRERAERAVSELRSAQDSLIQAETMASLGELVAGVAHEVNTPLGIGLTAASHIGDRTRDLRTRFDRGVLKKSDMADYLDSVVEGARLMVTNVTRAADLIQSFKRVAVDQTSGERRVFDLATYIDEVMFSLRPRLKRTAVTVTVDCPEGIVLDSYPGALSQILTNLTINAIIHAYADGTEAGTIGIAASIAPDDHVLLTVSDDGAGIAAEHRAQIFDPFFTTRREDGGSGLGLHIVFKTVTQLLGGTVAVSSAVGQGTRFTLTLPMTAPAISHPAALNETSLTNA